MKKVFFVIAILLLVAVVLYFLSGSKRTTPAATGAARQNPAANNLETSAPDHVSGAASNLPVAGSTLPPLQNIAAQAGQLLMDTNPVVDLPPAIVVANVRRAIRQYGEMFGGDPVGTNPEITSQLLGKNPKHINFVDPSAGMRVNGDGELVDAWGTPYFFHQISGSEMEIHSAGPDKIMWTSDDLVAK